MGDNCRIFSAGGKFQFTIRKYDNYYKIHMIVQIFIFVLLDLIQNALLAKINVFQVYKFILAKGLEECFNVFLVVLVNFKKYSVTFNIF